MSKQKIMHMVDVPAKQIPPFRYSIAKKAGIKKIMMTTWGGLGDQVCAEPTLRYAFKLFPDYEISLLSSFPDLFAHLPFVNVFDKSKIKELDDDDWLVLHTNCPNENMARDFIQHHFTQVVDFSSLCALQRQLPVEDRHVQLFGDAVPVIVGRKNAVVHPGRHWPSKTFPKWWWDQVIGGLKKRFDSVIIVGQDVSASTGTVDVDVPEGVMDLRNCLSRRQLVSILKAATVVVTNDSAPLHMAAAGDAYIIFVASCKEPDHLMHWRYGRFGWKMKNMGNSGLWNWLSSIPIRDEDYCIDQMPEQFMVDHVLPPPNAIVYHAEWATL